MSPLTLLHQIILTPLSTAEFQISKCRPYNKSKPVLIERFISVDVLAQNFGHFQMRY